MGRRRSKKSLPKTPVELCIEKLSHDGRGIAYSDGKTQFVEGALPGERVLAVYTNQRSKFDELRAEQILDASPERVTPPCAHAHLCGGCSLQHLATEAQIRHKEQVMIEQFRHFGAVLPPQLEPPLRDDTEGYRRKARLGVRYVMKRDEVLVGFREKSSNFLTAIDRCVVLDPRVGERITELKELLRGLEAYRNIAQIEVAIGDEDVALVVRNLEPLAQGDLDALLDYAKARNLQLYLQPGGPSTVHRIWPEQGEDRLWYRLEEFGVTLKFHPTDFTQVNAGINRKMVTRALDWLDPQPTDRVLDLFCGLGNFTLPLATRAGSVVGVEGDEAMVVRGRENAEFNRLQNLTFYGADLQADFTREAWAKEGFDKILIDPPRSGALEVVQYLPKFGAKRIVYVSCNPATLARDAGVLVAHGYRLLKAGVMDMFPHTTHVESIALFEK